MKTASFCAILVTRIDPPHSMQMILPYWSHMQVFSFACMGLVAQGREPQAAIYTMPAIRHRLCKTAHIENKAAHPQKP